VTLIDGGSGDRRVRIYDTLDPTMLPLGALRENLATLAANATEPARGSGARGGAQRRPESWCTDPASRGFRGSW
jgi:hypothetical protein